MTADGDRWRNGFFQFNDGIEVRICRMNAA